METPIIHMPVKGLSLALVRLCQDNVGSMHALEHGWANFSDKRPRFLRVNRLRPQSKLASPKSVVCCGLAVDHRDNVKSVQIK